MGFGIDSRGRKWYIEFGFRPAAAGSFGRRPMKRNWEIPAVFALALLLAFQLGDILYVARFEGLVHLPVLMYHHFEEGGTVDTVDTVVSAGRFREQMAALREAGYHTVDFHQVLAYVEEGAPLPDKPVLVTMDDGYASNLEVAAPVLEELGMCATVFVIGLDEGQEVDPRFKTPYSICHFSYEEAAAWVEKGVLDLQSHSFNLHQLAGDGYSDRDGVLQKPGESGEAYRQAILDDAAIFREKREGRVATPLVAMALPFGYYDRASDELLREAGIAVTVTTDERLNRLRVGDKGCLRLMGRINVTDSLDGAALVRRVGWFS